LSKVTVPESIDTKGQTMRNKTAVCCVSVFLILSSAACSSAGSIWAKRDNNMRDWYADDVARNIGDVLTILISEDSTVDNKAKRDLKKETDKNIVWNGEIGSYADIGDWGCSVEQRAQKQGRL
jgi:flagellar basal body L-ring protein FlgH